MSNKTIYIVTEGEYSDYRICAVFDNKELAQKYIKATTSNSRWSDEKEIEEWPLNELKKGYKFFAVNMGKNGNSTVEEANCIWGPRFFKQYNEEFLKMNVMAKDEKHAIKIVNEKRVQLIANDMWGKTE